MQGTVIYLLLFHNKQISPIGYKEKRYVHKNCLQYLPLGKGDSWWLRHAAIGWANNPITRYCMQLINTGLTALRCFTTTLVPVLKKAAAKHIPKPTKGFKLDIHLDFLRWSEAIFCIFYHYVNIDDTPPTTSWLFITLMGKNNDAKGVEMGFCTIGVDKYLNSFDAMKYHFYVRRSFRLLCSTHGRNSWNV